MDMAETLCSVQNELSTGWGEEKTFKTSEVNMKFETEPELFQAIYYDSTKGLEARGIIVKYKTPTPNPFPTYKRDFGCRPPRK
jgi:hypothetical protein